jgi:glutamate synthase domain-containing protein 2
MTQELCRKLAARGKFVPDIAIAGGFSSEDHIFKVLAMGSPFTKAVCMGRALMIPGIPFIMDAYRESGRDRPPFFCPSG